jgi:hypothetical protein
MAQLHLVDGKARTNEKESARYPAYTSEPKRLSKNCSPRDWKANCHLPLRRKTLLTARSQSQRSAPTGAFQIHPII